MTSVGNESRSDSSKSSSDVNVFGIVDNVDNKDLHQISTESVNFENSQKLKVTVKAKQVKEGVWDSYYHFVVAILITNTTHYWIPDWYDNPKTVKSLLAIHFIIIMVFVHMPINYMEIFLAQYTKEPPINLWKICPIFIGFCYSLIVYSVLQSWLDTLFCSQNLLYLVETVIYQAPWLKCPPELGKECLAVTAETELSMDCKIAANSTQIFCPDRGNFEFSAQYWFKSRYTNKIKDHQLWSDTQWKLVLSAAAHWLFVTMIVSRTIYKFGTTIYCVGIAILLFVVLNLTFNIYHANVVRMVRIAFQTPELADFVNADFWALAYISSVRRSLIVTPPLMTTFAVKIESKFNIAWCAASVTFLSFSAMLLKMTVRRGLMEALADKLHIDAHVIRVNDASAALAFMPQHFGTLPMPLMWTFYWFLIRYGGLLIHSSLVVQAILENLFFKYNVRKEFRIYFISLYCVTGTIANIFIIVKHSAMKYVSVIHCRIILAGISLLPVIQSIFIFLIYGLNVFINDIHFTSGSPPSLFWTLCWKALPFTLLGLCLATLFGNLNEDIRPLTTFLWIMKGFLIAIIPIYALKQIMYAVYNDNLAYLFNPVFDWGPKDKEVRKARKRFNPKTDIRSQPERTVDYVKPRESSRDLTVE